MKKVININFQGRVIPIEETAYEMLQQYIGSLRNYFANEEGRDEIINDIENRIAELFGETLKKGAACITDADVSKVMDSMGRPEDFEEPAPAAAQEQASYSQASSFGNTSDAGQQAAPGETPKKRLYRDEQDKILGGVASGLANYLNLDPAVIRIIFALLAIFGGSGFLIYIILWIVLPSRSLVTNIRKRLYRDADDRIIAGVCGGLAKYFDINPAIPRVIFAAPFIFGIITSIGRHFFDPGPVFVGGFGGGTFILVYIILWIVLPEALTAAEKLEMRGEKVDLNSIRNTVMSDMQGFKGRAQKMGEELSQSAQKVGAEFKETFQTSAQGVGSDIKQAARRNSSGIGNAFAILVKAFVYFIGGAIAFGLFVGLIALMGAGVGVMPLKDFMLQGSTQNAMAWGSLVLFLGIPVIALIVWFIRRLMGVRDTNKFIGFGFTAAWLVGLFCFIGLLGSLNRSFSAQVGIKEDHELVQPANGKMEVRIAPSNVSYYNGWMELDGLLSIDQDTLFLNTARVDVVQSKDSLYRVHIMKMSKGRNREQAQRLAETISFPIEQKDNILYLPETFTVSKSEKWRNQKVIVVIEVPLGKELKIDERIRDYEYFSIELGNRRDWTSDWDRDWDRSEYWDYDRDMKMTEDGLKWERDSDQNDNWDNNNKNTQEEKVDAEKPSPKAPADSVKKMNTPAKEDTVYRYQQTKVADKVQVMTASATGKKESALPVRRSADSPLASITRIF